ncbi:MAG TPA: GNAT family protein [Burkholderiaceae bacterium]|jgi:RimJ/RimL family protein N-acetyltransferase
MRISSTTLSGSRVVLRPLQAADGSALVSAASDGSLWNLPFTVIPNADSVSDYIAIALDGHAKGSMLPFGITLHGSDALLGSTRLWKIDQKNRKLEIGHTWISSSWQRSFVNTESKYLMLCFAFGILGCVRVQFTTDVLNERSRAAILRLGAVEEGIVRHERIMPDGRKRDSIRFSIIDSEWPHVRRSLEEKLRSGNIEPYFSMH